MADKPLAGAGLRGQSAGATALCTVGKTGSGLTYRGFDIKELAEKAKFEEVAYLLLKGKLPNQAELDHYIAKLKGLRGLPDALKTVLEQIPKDAHPMDVMRTGASMLGNLETEESFDEQQDVADRLLAVLPSIICYWYRFSHDGVRIDTETDDASVGGHFLHMLRGEPASELHAHVMNVSLILYAEHEFNASTFTARVCASTLSDMQARVQCFNFHRSGMRFYAFRYALLYHRRDWLAARPFAWRCQRSCHGDDRELGIARGSRAGNARYVGA